MQLCAKAMQVLCKQVFAFILLPMILLQIRGGWTGGMGIRGAGNGDRGGGVLG